MERELKLLDNKMELKKDNIEYLAGMGTPPEIYDFYDSLERAELCKDYHRLRSAAEDLGKNPEDISARTEVSTLIKELGLGD